MKEKTKKGIAGIIGAVIGVLAIANMGFQLHDNIENHKEPVEDNTTIEQPEEA